MGDVDVEGVNQQRLHRPAGPPQQVTHRFEQRPAIEHTDDRRQENRSPAYTIPIVPDCIPMAICSGQAYVGLRPCRRD